MIPALFSRLSKYFDVLLQKDMLYSLTTSKPTVNEKDLEKVVEFTRDFGQDG